MQTDKVIVRKPYIRQVFGGYGWVKNKGFEMDSTIISTTLTIILVPLAVYSVYAAMKKQSKNKEAVMSSDNFIITPSKIILWIGIISSLIFTALMVLMTIFPNDTAELWIYIIFGMFELLGIILIVYAIRWQVKVENDNIYFTPFIGKQKSAAFSDIIRYKTSTQGITVYTSKGKLFSAEYICIGYNILLERLKNTGLTNSETINGIIKEEKNIKEYSEEVNMNSRAEAEKRFNSARNNLLWVMGFSLVNVILRLLGSGMYMLFSATFPLVMIDLGLELKGIFLTIGIIAAFVSIVCYGICYLLSKKHKAFILVSLILFSIDTLFLIWILTLGFDISLLLDIAFHAWVLYSLSMGVKAWVNLKKMPPDEEIEEIKILQEDNQENIQI